MAAKRKSPRGTPSPIKGKGLGDWVAATHVDVILSRPRYHYSPVSALNRFAYLAHTYLAWHQRNPVVERRPRVYTTIARGITVFDTAAMERLPPVPGVVEIRRRAVDQLETALVVSPGAVEFDQFGRLGHDGSCLARYDRPCDCSRGVWLALLAAERPATAAVGVERRLALAILAGDRVAARALADLVVQQESA